MATGIIIALLIAICLIAAKSYLKKLAHGCCGAGGDEEKRSKSKHDLSDCKYRYTVYIDGMMCEHCKKHVETALKGLNLDAEVDLKNNCAYIYGGTIDESAIKSAVESAGYDFKCIKE